MLGDMILRLFMHIVVWIHSEIAWQMIICDRHLVWEIVFDLMTYVC